MAHMHATQMESAPPRPPVEPSSSEPIAEISATLLRAQAFLSGCGIGLLVREGGWLVCRAANGAAAPEIGARVAVENTFLGLCVTLKKPQSCEDADSDLRVENATYSRLRPKSILAVPVRAGQEVVAVLAGFSSAPGVFTNTQIAILRTVADSLSRHVQQLPLSPLAEEIPAPRPAPVVSQPARPESVRETPAKAEPQPAAAPAPSLPAPTPREEVLTLADDVAPRPQVREVPLPPPTPVRVVTYAVPRSFELPARPRRRVPRAALRIAAVTAACLLFAVVSVGWYSTRVPDAPPRVHAVPAAPAIHPASPVVAAPAVSAATPATAAPVTANKSQPALEVAPAAKPPVAEPPATEPPATDPPVAEVAAAEPIAPKLPQPAASTEAPALLLNTPAGMPALVAPRPAAPKIHHSEVVPARILSGPPPKYPMAARGRRIAGQVVCSVVVRKDGSVAEVKPISGNPVFFDSAIAALRQWRYTPATLDGEPVEAHAQVTLKFDPRQ